MDVGHDPVSGISRSGRVRKKSAKLIEMEDFDSEFMTDNPRIRKKLQLTSKSAAATDSSSPVLDKSPVSIRKVSPIKITTKSLMPLPTIQHNKRPHEGKSVPSIPRTPQFVSLPASGFLDDEDDTFLQTEEVDSEPAEFQPALLSPLKIDIGGDDGNSIAVREESGLKMKFILSPKMKSSPQIEHMVLDKPTSKKSEKKASQRSKKKKLQPLVTSTPNMAIEKSTGINVLASATETFSEDFNFFENEPGAHEIALTVDDVQDDGPKLVIAETPRAPPSKPKKKSAGKSKSNLLQIKIGKSSSSNSRSKSKKNQAAAVSHELEPMFCTDHSDMSTSEMVSQAQSAYFKEKKCSAKKKSGKSKDKKAKDKDGKVHKTRPITAYMLWCREYRQKIVRETPNMDFATISRRLGEVWQTLPEKTKLNWRRQAKNLSGKTGKSTNNLINTGKQSEGNRSKLLNKQNSSKSSESPSASYSLISVPGTAPIDVAAYLKLLGESLGNIGQRLTEHEGQIAVSGSLSVLLDSTLSVLGPLLCLTSQVKELNGCDKEVLEDIMDNIAYIMPGP